MLSASTNENKEIPWSHSFKRHDQFGYIILVNHKHINIIFMLSVTTYENKIKEYNNVTD